MWKYQGNSMAWIFIAFIMSQYWLNKIKFCLRNQVVMNHLVIVGTIMKTFDEIPPRRSWRKWKLSIHLHVSMSERLCHLGYLYMYTDTSIQNVVVVVLVLLKLAIWQFIMQFFLSKNVKLHHFSRINTCTKSANFIWWGRL